MSDSMKKQTFLHGTALLAMATAMVKIIGALYKIPLNMIIGPQGFGYFNTAYQIYNVLLMVSTAGLPVAMSRMISQASSIGDYGRVKKIYTVSKTIFLTLGLISAGLMFGFSGVLANLLGQPKAQPAIAILAPASFLICLMSTYRGFFQGQRNMIPTSVSQVLEAFIKLVVGIAAAVLLKFYTQSISLAAGGAIFGVTMSCLVSSFYLNHCYRKAVKIMPVAESSGSTKEIAKGLLAIAIPITIGSAGLQLLTTMETGIYMDQLFNNVESTMNAQQILQQLEIYGHDMTEALNHEESIRFIIDTQKGIYDMAITIFNMPCAFITPITISVIPAITAQISTGSAEEAKKTAESAARVTALIAMPCAIGLAVLAEPITALLGGYSGEMLALATQLMTILGVCIMFNATVLLTNAILQAHGHVNLPVVNMFVGGILKLVAIFILTGNPLIGIIGTPIGSILCYVTITVLNIITVRKVLTDPPAIVKNMLRGLIAALLMGGVAYGAWFGLKLIGITSRIILCGAPIAVGGLVYLVAAIALKAITREDCELLPKGDKIAKLLHL